MKIALFGATGKTGTEVLKQSMEKGYEINAFLRDEHKLQVTNSLIKPFVGDVLNTSTFTEVLNGVDAVVITLGGIVAPGIKNIITSMKENKIARIILMSSYPMDGTPEGMNYLKSAGMDEEKIKGMMPMINDKIEQEKIVKESGLDWIIIRPTFLSEGSKTGKYQMLEEADFTVANGISRADVADFILKVLVTPDWDNKIVSISN